MICGKQRAGLRERPSDLVVHWAPAMAWRSMLTRLGARRMVAQGVAWRQDQAFASLCTPLKKPNSMEVCPDLIDFIGQAIG